MADIGFRRKMMTIYRSSAEVPFASRSFDDRMRPKPGLVALALFYAVVIGIFALRVATYTPYVSH